MRTFAGQAVSQPWRRRQVLQAMAGSTALAMTGCCVTPVASLPDPSPSLGPHPVLAGPWPRQVHGPRMALDAHCHFFNAQDVPIAGFIKGPIAHDQPLVIRRLVSLLAPFVEGLTRGLAPTVAEEVEMLRTSSVATAALAFDKSTGDFLLERSFKKQFAAEFARNAIRHAVQPRWRSFLRDLTGRSDQKLFDPRAASPIVSLDSAESVLEALDRPPADMPPAQLKATRSDREIQSLVDGAIRLLFRISSPRFLNLAVHQRLYGVDAMFGSLVDYDHWLDGCAAPSALEDQIRLHEMLSVLSGGRLVPLVAYNPLKDALSGGAVLAQVMDAVDKRGFVGVKIYSPMGYQPDGTGVAGSDPAQEALVKPRLAALYEFCADSAVPVMGHTSHSMGLSTAHDALPAPFNWRRVFRDRPNLRLDLAHFGGDNQPARDNGFAWMRDAVTLMSEFPQARIYADTGFMTSLFDPADDLSRTMAALLRCQVSPAGAPIREVAADRILYGSDWFLVVLETETPTYPQKLYDTLTAAAPDSGDKIFWRNALSFYGLDLPDTRARLQRFYARYRMPPPCWFDALSGTGCPVVS